ncbi:MAG TPA: class I SAM-dependent methyltransferase [Planctomycetota bacterium]|nr:class I SAM-dependent methyltransferase [Planctomycetota bacterium]
MTEPLSYDWAEVYDDYASGLPGDVEFYLDEASKTDGLILELGCGTGRILIPIAEEGHTVTGVDVTPSMLQVFRDKLAWLPVEVQQRITLVEADMRNFDLGRRFALILCPYRAFLHNLTVDDQLATLAAVRRHLADDGCFVMNFFDPHLGILAGSIGADNQTGEQIFRSYFDSTTGNQVDVYEKRWHDPTTQVLTSTTRFVERPEKGPQKLRKVLELKLRWIYRWEMEHLFARAGLEVVDLFGNFDRGRFRYGREQVWVVRKGTST